jgi:hypothetical protein
VGGAMSYPAVGMLIFASCPNVSIRTGSHLFNSPRPCPQSRLGSRPKGPSHNALEVWPPHPSLHHVSALNAFLLKAVFVFSFRPVWEF